MVTKTDFQELVGSAYQSLYDFVRLRNHPLTQLLVPDDTLTNQKERGWQAHHMLLAAVEELYPGPDAPVFSREWRRHRLMVLRYVEALEPQTVADQLAISRRQYYREHAAALQAVAAILWERSDHNVPAVMDETEQAQVEAMQVEVARISQHDTYADLAEVINGVLSVLDRVLQQNDLAVEIDLPDDMPVTSIGHNLLRQVILGTLGGLVETVQHAAIRLDAHTDEAGVRLAITTTPLQALDEFTLYPQIATFQEMLRLGNAHIDLIRANRQAVGFELRLPLEYDCTVLAVDDNEDTLALYQRCLTPNRYRVVTAHTAQTVPNLARETRPDVIILDLMMPAQDGWDLLQLLSNQPATAHIPIMICSVLKQKQLALSLGATAFLEKPFTEQTLLDALAELRRGT